VFDREPWPGHSRIEEVDDDMMGASPRKADGRLNENFATPRVQSISTAFASPSRDEEDSQNDPLDSTPRLRTIPSFKPTPTISEYHSLQPTSTASAVVPPPINANGPTSALDDATEVSLVREVLNLLIISQEDIKFMNTVRHILSSPRNTSDIFL
jgi:hypothetical protein